MRLLPRWTRIRRRLLFRFYNLRVHRNPTQVRREITALLASRPIVLGLCEAIGYDLPQMPGYTLVRDLSTKSRQNIAAYVRDDQNLHGIDWHDQQGTWKRTDAPGRHEARAWLEMFVSGVQVIVGHQPPITRNHDTIDAMWEGISLLTVLMAPWARTGFTKKGVVRRQIARLRPRIALADWNTTAEVGPSPATLAARIDGAVVGPKIDAAVMRQMKAIAFRYPTETNSVKMLSDHGHFFETEVEV